MEHLLLYSKFESLMEKIVEKATPSRLDRLVDVARQMQLCLETSQVANLEGYRIASILVERIEAEVQSCRKIRVLYAISAVLRRMNPRRWHESQEIQGPWPASFETVKLLTGKDFEHARRIFLLWKRENILSHSFNNCMHDKQEKLLGEDEVESSTAGEMTRKECHIAACSSGKRLGVDRRMKSMSRWSRRVHTMRRVCDIISPTSP
eukprot:jgi/Picsp_1/2992/NSC_01215-R1_---NA---